MNKIFNAIYGTVPGMNFSYLALIIAVIGLMGALALMYAVFLEAERRQDAVFVVGSASLFVYALLRADYIIMFAMAGVFLLAGRELIQIMRGKHHHTVADIKEYEEIDKK